MATDTVTYTNTVSPTVTVTPTNTPYSGSPTDTLTSTLTPTAAPCTCPSYFGNITLGSQPPIDDSGVVDANQFNLVENAVVRTLSLYITATSGGNMRMSLYTDGGGHPDTLICESGDQLTTVGWNTVDIPVQTLPPGIYWIAWQVEPGTMLGYDNGASGEEAWFPGAYGAFPATVTTGSLWNYFYTVRADYCPVICGTPTYTFSASPTISPTASISVTPTYVGTCACPNMFGKSYVSAGTLSPAGFASANWWGISEDGNANSISINVASGSGNMRVGLYTNSTGGAPGVPVDLLCESADTPVNPGWNTISIPQVGLGAGTVYWVAFQVTAGVVLSAENGSASPPDLYYVSQAYGPFGSMTGATGAAFSFDVQVNYCPVMCASTPSETFTVTPSSTTVVNTPTYTYIHAQSSSACRILIIIAEY